MTKALGEQSKVHRENREESERPHVLPAPSVDCERLLQDMSANILEHVHIPVAVTSGQRSLVHKTSALAWAFFVDGEHVNSFVDSMRSFCSDMGVELGVPDFWVPGGCVKALLPKHLQEELDAWEVTLPGLLQHQTRIARLWGVSLGRIGHLGNTGQENQHEEHCKFCAP